MPQLTEGALVFDFSGSVDQSTKYDEWSYYRKNLSSISGTKAVDFIFLEKDICWLIEVKDYRFNQRTKMIDLADEISIKVRDTIAGLFAAKLNANDPFEKQFAQIANQKTRIRIVLHLEQSQKSSKIFPKVFDEANLQSKLKSKIKAIDPHPIVMDKYSYKPSINWEIS
jgi:hypothetical protein